MPQGGYSTAKLGAKNIRTELKKAFPGIKFSVTSETYSGGDSIDIGWTLGPTTAEVEKITGKYQEGHFDGMEDIYNTDRENVFAPLFGGAKYVSENRHEGEAYAVIGNTICARYGITPPADGQSFWNVTDKEGQPEDIGRTIRDVLSCQSFPAGAVVTGIEDCEDDRHAPGFAAYYRATFTAPAAEMARAVATKAASASFEGAQVSENEEKNGVEIRFSAKPAAAVLDSLKVNGWRWSRFSGCWYAKRTPESLAFAKTIAA